MRISLARWVLTITLLAVLSGCRGEKETAAPAKRGGSASGLSVTPGAPSEWLDRILTAEPSKGRSRRYTFAGLPKMLNNPVFKVAETGARKAAADLCNVDLKWVAPPSGDAKAQADMLKRCVVEKVDGIFVSVNEAQTLTEAIDAATEAGIPVFTFDSDAPASKRFSFYGVNDEKAGAKAARIMAPSIKKTGKVGILHGTKGAPNLERRIAGFTAEMKKLLPDLVLLEPVTCDDDINMAVANVRTVIRANKAELSGFYLSGGWPLFAKVPGPFADIAPGSIAVVSFDALEEELDYLRQGYVLALTGQKLFEWGYESVMALYLHVACGKRDFPAVIDSGFDLVTKENVEEYAKRYR
jgi:ribose transport system substrate-binding protein